MKIILKVLSVLLLVTVAGGWLYYFSFRSQSGRHFFSTSSQSGRVDSTKLLSAMKIYKSDLKRQGMEVPASVSLKELIIRGLLTEADVSGFSGIDVSVNLLADESHPPDALVRARLPDGNEITLLGDGSVQQVRR